MHAHGHEHAEPVAAVAVTMTETRCLPAEYLRTARGHAALCGVCQGQHRLLMPWSCGSCSMKPEQPVRSQTADQPCWKTLHAGKTLGVAASCGAAASGVAGT